MTLRKHAQAGFSLVELMVGMTVGIVLMAAVVALTVSVLRTNAETVTVAKLTQEGRAIGDLIAREVRRARYSGNFRQFVGAAGTLPNQFGVIQVGATNVPTAGSADCIRFAYDADDDGTLDTDEVKVISRFNGAVYFDQATTYATAVCVTDAASAAAALRVSSPDVNVTSLTFSSNSVNGALAANPNRLDVSFRLALVGDAAITRRFDQSIQLRNPFL